MCRAIPKDAWCDEQIARATAEPPMKMYFHTSTFDRILFEGWVTRTDGAFAGSWFACFFGAILSELLKLFRKRLEDKWEKDITEKRQDRASEPWWKATPFVPAIDLPRSLLSGLEMAWGLIIMLVAMTFNTALFIAIPLGTVAGTLLVGRYMSYKPPTGCCS